jgi:ribosome-binding factor A
MNDKRLGMISINNVSLSDDLRYAKIYVFFLNNISIKKTIYLLNNSSSYLRSILSKNH